MTEATRIEETKLKMKLVISATEPFNVLDPEEAHAFKEAHILQAFWTAYNQAEDELGAKPDEVIFGSGLKNILIPAINKDLSRIKASLDARINVAETDIANLNRDYNDLQPVDNDDGEEVPEMSEDAKEEAEDIEVQIAKKQKLVDAMKSQRRNVPHDMATYESTGTIANSNLKYYVGCQTNTTDITFVRINETRTVRL
jgi:hypothetical protein